MSQSSLLVAEQAVSRVNPAVSIRAARQDDGPAIQALVGRLSLKSRYYRFFFPIHSLSDEMLVRFTHAYPESEVTLLAQMEQDGMEVVVGMANYVVEAQSGKAEYAVVVADEWQQQGIATRLLKNLTCIASTAGLEAIYGDVLAENTGMLRLLSKMGFSVGVHSDGGYLRSTWKSLEIYPWKCADWLKLA
ncbi:GNAT family N-acetyltransferase [Undibacterium sp.]|jgi:acetyltransferase|uniref:GNAT family N-acetyltransferase n=1 Tax=Undibacterium sp. TaxID=1914977 RepID=UPI002B643D7D|nr:GNAT family N-acetyltransferase [Undibacterium sp.]HTD02573.1 GNAT family N-acetyltransferase [Undibacterium sp.]